MKNKRKITWSISDDGNFGFVFNETSEEIFAKINFYKIERGLSILEKKDILDKMTHSVSEAVTIKEEKRKEKSWITRCEAFKESYQYEKKEKERIIWLMMNILDLTKEEAARRWEVAQDLLLHEDFKNKLNEETIVNRIYLNDSHLKDSELKNVKYFINK